MNSLTKSGLVMILLLDTHIFIWWNNNPSLLPQQIYALCMDPRNSLVLSHASIWEMQIKIQQSKLKFDEPLRTLIERQIEKNGLGLLGITSEHIYALENLPPIHKDPFDRLLIAQSKHEEIKLVSVEKYGISTQY